MSHPTTALWTQTSTDEKWMVIARVALQECIAQSQINIVIVTYIFIKKHFYETNLTIYFACVCVRITET